MCVCACVCLCVCVRVFVKGCAGSITLLLNVVSADPGAAAEAEPFCSGASICAASVTSLCGKGL
jgi:hypothetical protein